MSIQLVKSILIYGVVLLYCLIYLLEPLLKGLDYTRILRIFLDDVLELMNTSNIFPCALCVL